VDREVEYAMKRIVVAGTLFLTLASYLESETAWAQTPSETSPPVTPWASSGTLLLLDAVRTTLRLSPPIQTAAAQLQQQEALVNVARGPFDPVVLAGISQARTAAPVLPGAALANGENALTTDTTSANLGASVATVLGTTIAPNVGLSRVYERANIPIMSSGFQTDPGQYATVGVNVTQPLLRGAGTVGAASALASAKRARDAAAHTADGVAQVQVYDTLLAYFQLVAAEQNLKLLRLEETEDRKVVEDTRQLVAGKQRPRSDLPGVEGNLANRTREVMEAEDTRVQAVYALATTMGLGPEGTAEFRTGDAFPSPSTPTLDPDSIIRLARRDRGDLLAAHDTVAAADELLRGAEHNTLPQLNLALSIGYQGALEKDGIGPFFAALGGNIPGVSGSAGLSLALPVLNTAQIADRDLKRSLRDQASIAEKDLERQLPIQVINTLKDLLLSRSALAAAIEAEKQFQQAVVDQRDKVHEGVGTVVDLVLTEELLITAELSRTANELRCATALAQVYLEMGALPTTEGATAGALARMFGPGVTHGAR
jgi:outer membrane protein